MEVVGAGATLCYGLLELFIGAAEDFMSDQDTTVAALRQLVKHFVDQRDWHQFHAPKNLSMALAIEAAELMEHFQWITTEASRRIGDDARKRSEVSDELADIVCYALAIANELSIDIDTAMRDKMKKNEAKYPAREYRGRYQ
ncbi:MAG: nucleotide pyrophosphohydrolase [Planctomycetota bacterium]